MLTQMTQRLRDIRTFEDVIQTILDDATGNLQLPIGDELAIAAQAGLRLALVSAPPIFAMRGQY